MPMMAPKRYVALAAIHKLAAKDQPALVAYLEKPSPTTVLVLSGEKLDGRTKLGTTLNKMGAVFTFEPPRQQEVAGFVMSRAKKRALKIEPEAARLLADLVGNDVGNLDRALDKVALYAGP